MILMRIDDDGSVTIDGREHSPRATARAMGVAARAARDTAFRVASSHPEEAMSMVCEHLDAFHDPRPYRTTYQRIEVVEPLVRAPGRPDMPATQEAASAWLTRAMVGCMSLAIIALVLFVRDILR